MAARGRATIASTGADARQSSSSALRGGWQYVRWGRHDARPAMTVPPLTTPMSGACRTQRVALGDGRRTWTVVDREHRVVEAAEEYPEYLRMLGRSPNTVKSYARALGLWWQFLDAYELAWDAVTIEDLSRFLGWLRSGDEPGLASIERRPARLARARWRRACRRSARCIATTTSTASRRPRVSTSVSDAKTGLICSEEVIMHIIERRLWKRRGGPLTPSLAPRGSLIGPGRESTSARSRRRSMSARSRFQPVAVDERVRRLSRLAVPPRSRGRRPRVCQPVV
jgi:hypothetical protein